MSSALDLRGIKNIIFDLGGVLLNIDFSLTKQAFEALGVENFDSLYTKARQTTLFDEFETGRISASEFREGLRSFLPKDTPDDQIDGAWNALLLDLPKARLVLLEELAERYRLILLSNTNAIHCKAFHDIIAEQHGLLNGFDPYFSEIYYSHLLGLRKPDVEVFHKVANLSSIELAETLFIDDTLRHVQGARKTGLQVYHLQDEEIADLFL